MDRAARLDMPGTVAAAGRLAARIAADRDQADPLTAREAPPPPRSPRRCPTARLQPGWRCPSGPWKTHVRSILAKTQCTNRIEFDGEAGIRHEHAEPPRSGRNRGSAPLFPSSWRSAWRPSPASRAAMIAHAPGM